MLAMLPFLCSELPALFYFSCAPKYSISKIGGHKLKKVLLSLVEQVSVLLSSASTPGTIQPSCPQNPEVARA